MHYVISPPIKLNSKGEWFEGDAYEKESLYQISDNKLPPVNYDKHMLKPHSLTHIETPLHVDENGYAIDYYFENKPNHFFGKCVVLKFSNDSWIEKDNGIKQRIISLLELKEKLKQYNNIEKVLITIEGIEENSYGYHNPNFVLTLSLEAAQYLVSFENFNLFGTSWKSTDFSPGSTERPIHKEIFKKALILEYINLNKVSEGEYFINCFPLNLQNASESPVTAVLFEEDVVNN